MWPSVAVSGGSERGVYFGLSKGIHDSRSRPVTDHARHGEPAIGQPIPRIQRSSSEVPDDEISLLGVLNVALKCRTLVLGTALTCAVITGAALLLMPRTYTSSSSFIIQTRRLPSTVSGLAAQFGLSLPSADPSQSPAFYEDLLHSRELLAAVVDSTFVVRKGPLEKRGTLTDLLEVRGRSPALRREAAIKRLGNLVSTSTDAKTGVVHLNAKFKHADLAEQVNRLLLDLLNRFNLITRQSQASAERKFTEHRLEQVRSDLNQAEDVLRSFNQRNREIRNSPELSLQQDRLNREVSLRQQVYSTLAQAYEQAKIEEVRDTPALTVLQTPEIPVKPDSRYIIYLVLGALILGAIVGLLIAMAREALRDAKRLGGAELEEFEQLRRATLEDLRHPLRAISRSRRESKGSIAAP
jgi:uncharacterized protein involved in exopolysaccharide biosynthesis